MILEEIFKEQGKDLEWNWEGTLKRNGGKPVFSSQILLINQ